jgi:hypothetical protein
MLLWFKGILGELLEMCVDSFGPRTFLGVEKSPFRPISRFLRDIDMLDRKQAAMFISNGRMEFRKPPNSGPGPVFRGLISALPNRSPGYDLIAPPATVPL